MRKRKERKAKEEAVPFSVVTCRYQIGILLQYQFPEDVPEKNCHQYFLQQRFLLQVFKESNIKTQRKLLLYVCFIWKCCIDSWINGMRGHAVCTAATIQETVEGNKTRCEFVRNQIEIEIGKGKRKMQQKRRVNQNSYQIIWEPQNKRCLVFSFLCRDTHRRGLKTIDRFCDRTDFELKYTRAQIGKWQVIEIFFFFNEEGVGCNKD